MIPAQLLRLGRVVCTCRRRGATMTRGAPTTKRRGEGGDQLGEASDFLFQLLNILRVGCGGGRYGCYGRYSYTCTSMTLSAMSASFPKSMDTSAEANTIRTLAGNHSKNSSLRKKLSVDAPILSPRSCCIFLNS